MAGALPNDATIEQVAEVFGVQDRLDELTPAARKLTKGQMVSILGVEDASKASLQVAVGARASTRHIERVAKSEGLQLTVHDIQSVEKIFSGADAFPVEARSALLADVSNRLKTDAAGLRAAPGGGDTIYLCCCPCCCATTVLAPAVPAVA